ncbi:iron only hydrogenase large subunit-like protein [Halanaerobium sp. DL-01]|nr:iron only hydrogenase large subunit-like protein [Halanaerobium sp. DL-01]
MMVEPLIVHPASCKDCHKCLRECGVGAIGFKDNQVWIIEDKCIYCGNCIKTCPQGAKEALFEKKKVESFLQSDSFIIASLAPSFAAAFPEYKSGQIITALKKLGFEYIAETAEAAKRVAAMFNYHAHNMNKSLITSCCPTVVNLIEKHYPELIPQLAPVLSPMMLQVRELKRKYKKARVIFIGPCLSKIEEMNRVEDRLLRPDIVINFKQLRVLFEENGIFPEDFEESEPDLVAGPQIADYPLSGGAVKAAGLSADGIDNKITSVYISGIDNIVEVLEDIKKEKLNTDIVELLACDGGCISGPAIENDLSIPVKEILVNNYLQKSQSYDPEKSKTAVREKIDLNRIHKDKKKIREEPPEQAIREILVSIGKYSKEDEKNCGGCGYSTCREKAAAVYYGFAEKKMCIPYMKSRAESLSQIIVESSHNAIIVVNEKMEIQEFNPVANKLFNKNNRKIKNLKLGKIIDSSIFKKAWLNQQIISHHKYSYFDGSTVVDQTIFPLPEHKVVIGILTDITEQEKQREEVQEMKKLAVEKTNIVINKQMQIVQEIAGLLGETTVETKAALSELSDLLQVGE